MDAVQAAQEFKRLRQEFEDRHLTSEEFYAAVEKLQFRDERGTLWNIGAQSGQWYFYDGSKWIRGDPTKGAVPLEPSGPPPPEPPPPTPHLHRPRIHVDIEEEGLESLLPKSERMRQVLIASIVLMFGCSFCLLTLIGAKALGFNPSIPIALGAGRPGPTRTPPLRVEVPSFSTPNPLPEDAVTYVSRSLSLTLQYPKDWTIAEGENSVTVAPNSDSLDPTNPDSVYLTIVAGPLPSGQGGQSSLEVLRQKVLPQLAPDARSHEPKLVTIGQVEWAGSIAEWRDPTNDISRRYFVAGCSHNSQWYGLTVTAPQDLWEEHWPMLQRIIGSLGIGTGSSVVTSTPAAPTAPVASTPLSKATPTPVPSTTTPQPTSPPKPTSTASPSTPTGPTATPTLASAEMKYSAPVALEPPDGTPFQGMGYFPTFKWKPPVDKLASDEHYHIYVKIKKLDGSLDWWGFDVPPQYTDHWTLEDQHAIELLRGKKGERYYWWITVRNKDGQDISPPSNEHYFLLPR